MGKKLSTQSKGDKEEKSKRKSSATHDKKTPNNTKDNDSVEAQTEELENAELTLCYAKDKEKVTKDSFELLTVIGKGSFGKVMQVKKKDTGQIYAMKVLRKEAIIARKQVIHTKAEKNILQKIQHPFIVALVYAFQTEEKLYMVLEYINGGELFFHLKKEGKFSEQRVKLYAAEISSALAHLHSFEIVYRDLKPENILIDAEGHICITDFGLSKEIQETGSTHTFCGTPEYLAPEVLRGQGHGTAVDWWSLGTLVFEMLTGLPPFWSGNIHIMYQRILNGELRFPNYISPEAQSFLEGLLNRDPVKRLGDSTIKQHPWFADIDWVKLDKKEIVPTFKPKVNSILDTTQIDPVFTGENPVDSLVESSVILDSSEAHFDDFSYINPHVLGNGKI